VAAEVCSSTKARLDACDPKPPAPRHEVSPPFRFHSSRSRGRCFRLRVGAPGPTGPHRRAGDFRICDRGAMSAHGPRWLLLMRESHCVAPILAPSASPIGQRSQACASALETPRKRRHVSTRASDAPCSAPAVGATQRLGLRVPVPAFDQQAEPSPSSESRERGFSALIGPGCAPCVRIATGIARCCSRSSDCALA
jgi:hypothetical protein